MTRPTLSQFRTQFPTDVMGVCAADPAVIAYCNDATQRLMLDVLCPDEGWIGMWATMHLTAAKVCQHAYVTTPREVARIIVMGVCQTPVHMRNGFYEYLNFGNGLQPKACLQGCHGGRSFDTYDRDNVVTLFDFLTTPQNLRFYPTDARDAGFRVLSQGLDANGQVVLTTDPGTGQSAPGEYIALGFPFVDSVNTYSRITGLQKDQTYGPVQIFQVDPVTGVETALSTMEPNESVASYRRYLINGIPNFNCNCPQPGLVQITCQVRLDFIPVANETDYLTIPNVPALIEESISIRYSRMDSPNAQNQAISHHMRAIALLNGQLDAVIGKVSTAVRVPIFGSQKLHRQLV